MIDEEINIVEKQKVPAGATMLFGFPDVGLVGVIAASQLIDELNLSEIAYMESKLLPPVVVLHDGLPHSPIRILGNQNILVAVSETPLPTEIIHPIMNALMDWGRNKNVRLMISLSGMPIPDRQDAKELKVFAAGSTPEALKISKEKGVETLGEGYMVGPQAIMLQRGAKMGLSVLALLAQCFYNYPDPEAAAEILKSLTKITGVKVDVTRLLEKGEEIRLKARDVMKRTEQEMSKMKKAQEYDIPLYVS